MKLFVFIDFEDSKNVLVRLASQWCIAFDMELVFIHKIDVMLPTLVSSDDRLKIEYDLKREVFQNLEKIKSDLVDRKVKTTYEIISKPLIEYLNRESFLESKDIFLFGLKGGGMMKQIFIGSTVTKIVDELNQLTITIPTSNVHSLPSRLIVGVHYLTPINQNKFKELLTILSLQIVEIEFVTIIQNQIELVESKSYLELLKKMFGENISCHTHLFSGENALQKLKDFSSSKENAYLVLQKGSRALSDKLFRKFMINEMVFDASIPLIILPK